MTDALRWLVTFASPYHLFWFLISVAFLAGSLLSGGTRREMHICGVIGHLIVVFEAVLVVSLRVRTEVFSVHCIWFNLLMAIAHWLLLESWARRQEREP